MRCQRRTGEADTESTSLSTAAWEASFVKGVTWTD
jgi:hypothetical protein